MQDPVAIIVGAGPSGLATSACLNQHSIPHILLEREDCYASLWKKYSYDRLRLHLRKQFCELPRMSFPDSYPTYVPKDQFLQYLDDYVSHFKISPMYQRSVEFASFDEEAKKWNVKARNVSSGKIEEYSARFLVVASGETSNPFIPEFEGLNTFTGEVLHSTEFKNGKTYCDKNVLVVGSGNSGMEIALDLANHGARTSIAIRSPIHILSREMVYLGLNMLKYFSCGMVDKVMVMLSKLVYGDLSKHGIKRPKEGPFFMKVAYGKYPVFDVGTCNKIKSGEIQVLPALESIRGNEVLFENGKSHPFDTIVFCTGFERSTNKWLKVGNFIKPAESYLTIYESVSIKRWKYCMCLRALTNYSCFDQGDDYLLNEDGIPKPSYPNHWKGKDGLYCIGLSRRGLYGASADAQNVVNDIKALI